MPIRRLPPWASRTSLIGWRMGSVNARTEMLYAIAAQMMETDKGREEIKRAKQELEDKKLFAYWDMPPSEGKSPPAPEEGDERGTSGDASTPQAGS